VQQQQSRRRWPQLPVRRQHLVRLELLRPGPKQAFASPVAAARKSTGVKISVNTVDHNTFQNDNTSYLQGTPNDPATWFAGYRMQYFAAQGLLEPIDDVWAKIGNHLDAATTALAKGADEHFR
jgi:multiple sugar transport system substrate-binding protein